jgi:hypothetical protein
VDIRRARRALWAFRLIFYPGAVLVAVLLLTGRSEGEVRVFEGKTSQGLDFGLRIDKNEQPGRIATAFRTRCPGGPWVIVWVPYGPFHLEDGVLKLRRTTTHRYTYGGQTSRRVVTFEAHIDGGRVRGTATAVEEFDGPVWGRYLCESGAVSFSAG